MLARMIHLGELPGVRPAGARSGCIHVLWININFGEVF